MTSNTKLTKKIRTRKRLPGDLDPVAREGMTRLQSSDWLVLPLGFLAAISLYVVWNNFPNVLPNSATVIFSSPAFGALLIILFSALYLYKTMKRAPRHFISKMAAYALSFLFVAVVIYLGIASSGNISYLALFVFLYNPYTLPIIAIVSIAGIMSLLLKRK